MEREVVVVGGVRTPIGGFGGSLKAISPSSLGAHCVRAAVARSGVDPQDIGHVVFGNVIHTLRAMKRSPLGLDLYLWLTYRTFGLKRPLRLTWPVLYRQLGVDPAKATDKFTVRDFREDCLRELKKIKDAWPDLHYSTAKGALILSPSPPRIAPSQLGVVA